MERFKFLQFSLVLIIILAAGHSFFHFYFYGTGIAGFRETGISGLVSGEEDVGEEATGSYDIGISVSQIFVVCEWLLAFALIIFAYIKGNINFKKEVIDLKIKRSGKDEGNKTDLDRLYELLQEKKRIRFMAIQKVFEIDDEVVKNWADTLEAGNLATVVYPRIGEPELVLKEKDKNWK